MDAMSPAMLMQAYTYIHTYVHNDFQKKQEKSSAAKKEMISDHRSRVGARDYCYNFSQRVSGFIIYIPIFMPFLSWHIFMYLLTYIEQIVPQFLFLIMIDNSLLLYGENSILTFRHAPQNTSKIHSTLSCQELYHVCTLVYTQVLRYIYL